MSSITKQRVGKYIYLYESESFWDTRKKRPDNKKVRIGKIDLLTSEPVYTKEYLGKLASAGESIEGMGVWDKTREAKLTINNDNANGAEAIRAVIDSVKDFGVVYFLQSLSEKTGILGILRDTMPEVWQEVFCLACYLIVADKPVMYCDQWVASKNCITVNIRETMKSENLFKQMTFDRLIFTLSKLKSATVNGKTILRPATKEQTDIFKAFGIPLPEEITRKAKPPQKRGRKPQSANTA